MENKKSLLSEFTRRAAQRLQDKRKPLRIKLHVESIDEDIVVRGLTEDEIFECQDMNTDESPLRGDKYGVYIGTVSPDLRAVAKELLEIGEIKEAIEVVNIFSIMEITEIAREQMKLSGFASGGVTRIEALKN
ncbi:MAG: hypothetical protein RR273_05585 [Oscillospiraceae bacterium]